MFRVLPLASPPPFVVSRFGGEVSEELLLQTQCGEVEFLLPNKKKLLTKEPRKKSKNISFSMVREENMADCSSIFRAWRHCGLHCRDDNDASCGSANTVDGAGSISNGRYAVPWLLRCMPDDAAQRGHWRLLQGRWVVGLFERRHLARGVGQGGRRTISERSFTRSD